MRQNQSNLACSILNLEIHAEAYYCMYFQTRSIQKRLSFPGYSKWNISDIIFWQQGIYGIKKKKINFKYKIIQ